MMQMRTHTCNQLRASDAGKSVKIVGWMENVREVGGNLAFYLDLVRAAREHIVAGDFASWKEATVKKISSRL